MPGLLTIPLEVQVEIAEYAGLVRCDSPEALDVLNRFFPFLLGCATFRRVADHHCEHVAVGGGKTRRGWASVLLRRLVRGVMSRLFGPPVEGVQARANQLLSLSYRGSLARPLDAPTVLDGQWRLQELRLVDAHMDAANAVYTMDCVRLMRGLVTLDLGGNRVFNRWGPASTLANVFRSHPSLRNVGLADIAAVPEALYVAIQALPPRVEELDLSYNQFSGTSVRVDLPRLRVFRAWCSAGAIVERLTHVALGSETLREICLCRMPDTWISANTAQALMRPNVLLGLRSLSLSNALTYNHVLVLRFCRRLDTLCINAAGEVDQFFAFSILSAIATMTSPLRVLSLTNIGLTRFDVYEVAMLLGTRRSLRRVTFNQPGLLTDAALRHVLAPQLLVSSITRLSLGYSFDANTQPRCVLRDIVQNAASLRKITYLSVGRQTRRVTLSRWSTG